ncbi:MAG: outer membrane protein assembly factor BamD [Deltaproteobacteria bacterium]|nr:outer membrane protein assembly factor BamD [Deltaproteobacteria bacterium]
MFFLMVFALLSIRGRAEGSDRPYYTDIGQFNYAKFLMREGDYKAASKEFARFIEGFPESPLMSEAQFGLSKAYFYAGLFREAEEELSLYLSNFGDSPDALEALALLGETEKKLKEKSIPVITPRPGEPVRALRAVQVMLFEGKDYTGVEEELESLRNAGVDTVILRVFHNTGDRYYPFARPGDRRGVYFKTSNSPVVDDILAQVVPAAHRRGLKVFAWMTTRYADYGVEGDGALSCKGYDIARKTPAACKGLDLFNEDAVRRLEGIYSDLAEYDIDGVLFQDDLVLRHNEGFGPFMESEFRKDTGDNADPEGFYLRQGDGSVHYTQPFWKWASWKNRRLLKVAQRLRDAVRKKRPQAKFAINLMYESVTNPPYALAWLSQNLDEAVKAGFDYYSIMAYHRQMEEELNKTPEEVREMIARMAGDAVKAIGEPGRVLIKLQTIDWRTGNALQNSEVVSVIRQVKGKDLSLALVPYRGDFPFHELGGTGAEGMASIGINGAI